jgi:hypothetical protein
MENINKKIDYFEDLMFHPSLDIKNKILVLGFRIKPEKDKEENIFLIASEKSIQITNENYFVVDGISYQINTKNRRPSKLSKQWNMEEMQKTYDAISTGTPSSFEIVKAKEVFDMLKGLIKDHLDLDDIDYTLLTVWTIGTYFFPTFSAYPYLHIKAPKGSGKSQCLNLLKETCFNAVKARASLPALRDTVDSLRGTYLMDQADALHRNNQEDFLDILTDSYKRGGGDIRKMIADKGKNWNLEEFQAYGPKGFASISQLPEDLRDRCLVIALTKSKKNYKPLDEEDLIWKEIRGCIYKFLITNFIEVASLYGIKSSHYRANPDPKIIGRQLELWLPLEVMMFSLGVSEEEQEKAKERFKSRYGFSESQANDLERSVIETVLEIFEDKTEIIFSPKEISEKIDDLLFEEKDGFHSSAKQKSAQVGRIINKFNLSSQKLPRNNKGERYLFKKEQVQKVFDGYLGIKTEVEDTPTYTKPEEPVKLEDIW